MNKGIGRCAAPIPDTVFPPMKELRNLFIVTLLLGLFATQGRAQSALDGFDPNANGDVNVAVVQPDGKILIGGNFSTLAPNGGPSVARNRIARLNPDGSVDLAFDPNAADVVNAIALQVDGKILIGGHFDQVGGQARKRFARLDPITGTPDSFNPIAGNDVFAIAVQSDGKILLGGKFDKIGSTSRKRIARIDPNTALPDSFNPNAPNDVLSIVIEPSGNVLVGGRFDSIGGQNRRRIARLDAVTGLADAFNPNADGDVLTIALQANGKILAGGKFNNIGGQNRKRIGGSIPQLAWRTLLIRTPRTMSMLSPFRKMGKSWLVANSTISAGNHDKTLFALIQPPACRFIQSQ